MGSLNNVTVAVGREALLTCVVENLSNYKVRAIRCNTHVHIMVPIRWQWGIIALVKIGLLLVDKCELLTIFGT